MNFQVPRGQVTNKTMDLVVDDRVAIKFSVLGNGDDGTIDFSLLSPDHTIRVSYAHKGNVDYVFTCNIEGEYVMCFDNLGSSVDKTVYLNYDIQHYIMGIPQALFLTIVIALVCIGMVAIFILSSKTH